MKESSNDLVDSPEANLTNNELNQKEESEVPTEDGKGAAKCNRRCGGRGGRPRDAGPGPTEQRPTARSLLQELPAELPPDRHSLQHQVRGLLRRRVAHHEKNPAIRERHFDQQGGGSCVLIDSSCPCDTRSTCPTFSTSTTKKSNSTFRSKTTRR